MSDKYVDFILALCDLARVGDLEAPEAGELLEPLNALVEVINFRDEEYKLIRMNARTALAHGPFSKEAVHGASVILKKYRKIPHVDIGPTPLAVITQAMLLDKISFGIKAILVEIAHSLRLDEDDTLLKTSTTDTLKQWEKLHREFFKITKELVEFFPKEQVLAISLASQTDKYLQRYLEHSIDCGLSQVIPSDILTKNVPESFINKMETATSVQDFLNFAPDQLSCSLCLEPRIEDPFEFVIMDACNHLFCVECVALHFSAPSDGFCPVEDCRQKLNYFITKECFNEYKQAKTTT